jgi:hypothetical protein
MAPGGRFRRGAASWICALAMGGAVWIAAAASAQAASFGELIVLRGRAVVTRGEHSVLVQDRAPVDEGDRVDALADSKVQILIGGKGSGMEALLAARTSIVVGPLKQDSGLGSPISLAFGVLRMRVRAWSGQPFVSTRAAVIGIKGTDFVTWVKRPQAAEFVGVEGLIECVSRSNKEFSIRIGQRQWGEIVENQKPKAPIAVPDDIWEQVQTEYAFPQQ